MNFVIFHKIAQNQEDEEYEEDEEDQEDAEEAEMLRILVEKVALMIQGNQICHKIKKIQNIEANSLIKLILNVSQAIAYIIGEKCSILVPKYYIVYYYIHRVRIQVEGAC